MEDKTTIGISDLLRQFIKALVEEVVIEGKSFDDQKKKYLKRYSKEEGVDDAALEKNLTEFFIAMEDWKALKSKSSQIAAKMLAKDCYLSEETLEILLASKVKNNNNNSTVVHENVNVREEKDAERRKKEKKERAQLPLKNNDKTAIDESNQFYRISNGSLYGLKPIHGRVELPSVVDGQTVIRIGDSAFARMGLESVVIPDTVTKIGSNAFEQCQRMKVAVVPDSVTDIGEGAFRKCRSLTRIDLPNRLRTIEPRLFAECESLIHVDIPVSVSIIRKEAFRNSPLQKIVIPDSVTMIEDLAFYYCRELLSLTMSKRVVKIGSHAFGGCRSLKSIVIPNSVESIEPTALMGCDGLKELTIGRSNYEKVKSALSPTVSVHFID